MSVGLCVRVRVCVCVWAGGGAGARVWGRVFLLHFLLLAFHPFAFYARVQRDGSAWAGGPCDRASYVNTNPTFHGFSPPFSQFAANGARSPSRSPARPGRRGGGDSNGTAAAASAGGAHHHAQQHLAPSGTSPGRGAVSPSAARLSPRSPSRSPVRSSPRQERAERQRPPPPSAPRVFDTSASCGGGGGAHSPRAHTGAATTDTHADTHAPSVSVPGTSTSALPPAFLISEVMAEVEEFAAHAPEKENPQQQGGTTAVSSTAGEKEGAGESAATTITSDHSQQRQTQQQAQAKSKLPAIGRGGRLGKFMPTQKSKTTAAASQPQQQATGDSASAGGEKQ